MSPVWSELLLLALAVQSPDRIALVTKEETSPAARSLRQLWPDRLSVSAAAARTGALALVLDGPLPPEGAYRTVVVDLALFPGGAVSSSTLENPNRLPIDPFDIKTIEEVGREYGLVLQGKAKPSERALAVKAGLQAEVGEPIPSIRIVAADPALRGFAAGDVLPWCGQKKGVYRQRAGTFPPDVAVLAVSTLDGRAVIVRKGNLYGIDLDLEEPTLEWDNRGAFHKWVPLSNLAGFGVRAGRFRARKPTYAEFAAEVRAFARAHPEWAIDVVGRRGEDEIHSLTLGDPSKDLYVFIGMPHAEDEWAPSLGSLSFAELLGRLREEPEVKRRLEQVSVKIYPLIHPSTYESPRSDPGAPRTPDRLDLEKTRRDRALSITQLHQGGDVLVPACGTPLELGRRIAERAKRDFAGRHVWWNHHHGKFGPQVWEEHAPVAAMPPSWSVYWWQDGRTSCYGLYPHDTVFAARSMFFVEQDFLLLMPHRFTQAGAHHALHRMFFEHSSLASLLLSDQTANWCLSILLTDPAGLERDAAWRPEPKRPK